MSSLISRHKVHILLGVVIIGMFAAIELSHPWFFLQDDNCDQNLPYYVHNLRAICSGEFPLFNFHQYLGTPIHACIQSAALYLPNYGALLISKAIFGHYFGTMEIIALFHLLLAAFGTFRLMQSFGLAKTSCFFGAVTWAFCAFVITVGNSWIQVIGYAAYFPWILLFSLRLARRFVLSEFIVLVILRVLDLFLGYPPYFIYSATLDILAVTVIWIVVGTERAGRDGVPEAVAVTWQRFGAFSVRQATNYLCVMILSAPLLLPALYQLGISADRKERLSLIDYSHNSYHFSHWLHGIFIPFFDLPQNTWCEQQFISHIGYLTIIFCVAACFCNTDNRKLIAVFMGLALFSFLWANDTIVTELFYHLPLYNRLRWPFKLVFFTSFFLIVTASFGFDTWQRSITRNRRKSEIYSIIPVIAIVVQIVCLLALYTLSPQRVLSKHSDPPPFTEPMKDILATGRIVSICTPITMDGEKQIQGFSVPLLGFNYATMFDLYHFAGYELLVSEKNLAATLGLSVRAAFTAKAGLRVNIPADLPLEYLREWGVRWYVIERTIPIGSQGELKTVFSDDRRIILEDPSAKPFVYWLDTPDAARIQHRFTTNSLLIAAKRDSVGPMVINILYNRFFRATIDSTEAVLSETGDNQMLLTVPAGSHEIKIRYVDPYFRTGLGISTGFLLLAFLGAVLHRAGRRRPGPERECFKDGAIRENPDQ